MCYLDNVHLQASELTACTKRVSVTSNSSEILKSMQKKSNKIYTHNTHTHIYIYIYIYIYMERDMWYGVSGVRINGAICKMNKLCRRLHFST